MNNLLNLKSDELDEIIKKRSIFSKKINDKDSERNKFRIKSLIKILNRYKNKNKKCHSKMKTNPKYKDLIGRSINFYLTRELNKSNIKTKISIDNIDVFTDNEFENLLEILETLPDCKTLLEDFEKKADDIDLTSENDVNMNLKDNLKRSQLNIQKNDIDQFIKNIGKNLQDISFKLDKVIDRDDKVIVSSPNQDNYINPNDTQQKIDNKKNIEKDMEIRKQNDMNDTNFAFQQKQQFEHIKPSKEIISSYGWSFMPPQFWSVPQKRPPVCIANKNEQGWVTPILDQGLPVDTKEWTHNEPTLPQKQYENIYDDNYYYPGWIAQQNINDPFQKKNNPIVNKSNYYNNNLATKP